MMASLARTCSSFQVSWMLCPLKRPKKISACSTTKNCRFVLHKIKQEDSTYKLCRVKEVLRGPKNTPYTVTHDGRTIKYLDPNVKANGTLRLDLSTGKVLDYLKCELGNTVMISGGKNIGRVGTLTHRARHPGSFEIVHVREIVGHYFATRLNNVFAICKDKP